MFIRKSQEEDLNNLLTIYDIAKNFMRENGNKTQWSQAYPSIELLKADINSGNSYVCVEENEIVGTFYFEIGEDPTYKNIYDGMWLNDEPYGVIHRIAVAKHNTGVAVFCLNWCLGKCKNIKIDTHRDNVPMQKFILKNGFLQCGIILRPDGTERLAYQKS
ncbi:MAG: GNAT family N-acetyltransferase [bacterium]